MGKGERYGGGRGGRKKVGKRKSRDGEGWDRKEKIERERGRLRGNEEYRELRKGQGREVEGEGKRKVE